MSKSKATQEEIDKLFKLVYPEKTELALTINSERDFIIDTTNLIIALHKRCEEGERLLINIQTGILNMPAFENSDDNSVLDIISKTIAAHLEGK